MESSWKPAWNWTKSKFHFWVLIAIIVMVYGGQLIFAVIDGLGFRVYLFIIFLFLIRAFILLFLYSAGYSFWKKFKELKKK